MSKKVCENCKHYGEGYITSNYGGKFGECYGCYLREIVIYDEKRETCDKWERKEQFR